MKSSFLATKSVSQFNDISIALVLSTLFFAITTPSVACLSALFAATF